MTRLVARVLLVGYGIFLALVLLWPQGSMPTAAVIRISGLLTGIGIDPRLAAPALVEVVSNVLIAVPPALLGRVAWARGRWWQWTLGGLAAAVAVETTQAVFLAERTPSVVDVVANTLGVALGAGLAGLVRRVRDYRGEGRR